jgi:hypothetical protein
MKQHILNGTHMQPFQPFCHPHANTLEHRHRELIKIVGFFRQV